MPFKLSSVPKLLMISSVWAWTLPDDMPICMHLIEQYSKYSAFPRGNRFLEFNMNIYNLSTVYNIAQQNCKENGN